MFSEKNVSCYHQSSQYASVTQRSEYPRICLDRVLNNILGSKYAAYGSKYGSKYVFWICSGSEYARATQGSKYATA